MKTEKLKTVSWNLSKLIIPALIGYAFAYFTFYKQFNAEQIGRLDDNLNKILDVSLQYPYVNDSVFISRWNLNKDSNSDSALRYNSYCEYTFDCLDNVADYFDYNLTKVNNYVDANDLIIQQKGWWDEKENQRSYSPEFVAMVNHIYYKN